MSSLLLGILAVFAMPCLATRLYAAYLGHRYPPMGEFHTVGGIRLHVVDQPANRPDATVVVCIHGASGTLRDMVHSVGQALQGRYRVICVDRPGHGHSAPGDRSMSDPSRQAELISGLCGQLGVHQAIVVGQSWGAAVAASMAVSRADLVSGLVLVAPASHPWPGGVSRLRRIGATPILGRLFSEFAVVPIGLFRVECALRKIFGPGQVPAGYRMLVGADLALRPATFRATSRDIAGFYAFCVRQAAAYHRIKAHVAIVSGDADQVVAPAIHSYALVRDIPGARLTTLAGIGHMPHWSAPEAVNAAIDRLANGCDRLTTEAPRRRQQSAAVAV